MKNKNKNMMYVLSRAVKEHAVHCRKVPNRAEVELNAAVKLVCDDMFVVDGSLKFSAQDSLCEAGRS